MLTGNLLMNEKIKIFFLLLPQSSSSNQFPQISELNILRKTVALEIHKKVYVARNHKTKSERLLSLSDMKNTLGVAWNIIHGINE